MAPLTGRNLKRMAALAGFYVLAGNLLAPISLYDGVIIMKGAEDRATEVIRVAMQHPQMMKVIDAMIEGNVYFNLAMGHGIVLVAILMNHNRIPQNPSILGYFGLLPEQIIPKPQEPAEPMKRPRTRTKKHAASPV